MAGIYIHVPFCTKRCLYCDFYSNTEMKYKEPYLVALQQEMELRKEYLAGETIETIYFGGGTPSQLQPADFSRIFDTIGRLFQVSDDAEITLEANPDDLQPAYVQALRPFPFNRISMGVQSFDDADLRFLNRRHDSRQAVRAVELCQDAGITNVSIDLIYGLPGQTVERWDRNLEAAIRLDVPHLSAYHLIYEEGTALYKLLEAGRVTPVEESVSVDLFTRLIDRLTAAGYLHYEISNFARPGSFSRHNSTYWLGKSYLGLGPSAHSYNQQERMWNVSSLPIYIAGMGQGLPNVEREPLPLETRYNDFVITGLRTMWGIDLEEMERRFGKRLADYCRQEAATYLRRGLLSLKGTVMTLSRAGIFVSDGIMSDLLWVDS